MMRRSLSALLLLCLLTGCSINPSQESAPPLRLYYLSSDTNGPAIEGQLSLIQTPTTPQELISALLEGPTNTNLVSPFPEGLTLRGTTLTDGHLVVDLSEQYGGLTDISLTLADYCVVLTACQLDEVDSVEITVSGRSMEYRSHQSMTAEEASLFLLPPAKGSESSS